VHQAVIIVQDMQFDGKQDEPDCCTLHAPRQTDPQQLLAQGAIAEERALTRGRGSSLFGFQCNNTSAKQYTTPTGEPPVRDQSGGLPLGYGPS